MKDRSTGSPESWYLLNERAKELNCLYQVDEYLRDERLSLNEMFEKIVQVIPSGWQYPDVCHARIVYDNCSYQTEGFCSSSLFESAPITLNDKVVGQVEVVYIGEIPQTTEDYFLENESKLIRTIADRISQTLLHRQLKYLISMWNVPDQQKMHNTEWRVIVDLLYRTDPDMLLHICTKMINFLYWTGIKEAEAALEEISPGWKEKVGLAEANYPTAKPPIPDIGKICEKTFAIAQNNLSDTEISLKLRKWIQEQKAHYLVKTVDRIGASLGEIIDAILRYQNMAGSSSVLDYSTERWLLVALTRRFLSDNLDFIEVARRYLTIDHFCQIVDNLIYPTTSMGKIGGKSTGLYMAHKILEKESIEQPILQSIKIPKTWYITTDTHTEFLHYNNLEDLKEHKYKDLSEVRMNYPGIIRMVKNGKLPPDIVKSLAMCLDDFGNSPIIVRSSSLLEDQMGAAFSGKYKSLFLANQGTKQQRLEALQDAILEVYASLYSPDSIKYRSERGLLDFHEEMGIMIQEVVGTRIGPYFLPVFAGVGFSNNEFRWSPRIKREDGLVRMVMGLGTRAVDRLSDDFPVLIAPGCPNLRVNILPDEVRRYSPKKIDLINLDHDRFETIEITELLSKYGAQIPNVQQILSVDKHDYIDKMSLLETDFNKDELIPTFEGLITGTNFIKKIDAILKTLQEKLGTPVDIEFACDGKDFYLLQCRPQSSGMVSNPGLIPREIDSKDIVFSANKYISNGVIRDITHIVYVDPEGYNSLRNLDELISVGRAVGKINSLLPKHRFILMGPGRWGSRGDIKMGVQVGYADISNTAALIEIARQKNNYIPELSFGTHFFQDLVEANIRYLPLYPDSKDVVFNERFLTRSTNILPSLLPEYAYLEDVLRVIDVPSNTGGRALTISMNADLEEALAYLTNFSGYAKADPDYTVKEKLVNKENHTSDDRFWRWRFYMAQRIAAQLDPEKYGVQGVYLIGSTNNGTAGPGSDIDLVIHFTGSTLQHTALIEWLQGWSLCLAEMNYLKTGYPSDGLLDIHFISDEDIIKRAPFALKISGITDPAYQLSLGQASPAKD